MILLLIGFSASCQTEADLEELRLAFSNSVIQHQHIQSSDILNAPQNIHILTVPIDQLNVSLVIDLAWSDSLLYTTSYFAQEALALAAVNGGFFNVAQGGSVSYLEYAGEQVAHRSWRGDTPLGQKTNLNGAVVVDLHGMIHFEQAKSSSVYLQSNAEAIVMVTGPILLEKGKKSDLLSGSFVANRHPRTCLALNDSTLFLITVDGRHQQAKGMSLPELQNFLLDQGCTEAINLDGGGSTTLWVASDSVSGVINCPADNGKFDHLGERTVANAILLKSLR